MTEKYTPRADDYIRVQGNRQYLPVPNRVQWFRGEHPSWTIDTDVIRLEWEAGYVVMRAEVRNDEGRVIAAGTKTETRKGFADFVEKAETGAVGRALARAGYGTEDALDLEGDRYADAPIEQPGHGGGSPSSPRRAPAQNQYRRGELAALMKEHDLTLDGVEAIIDRLGIPSTERPIGDASMDRLIEAIESERAGSAPQPAPSTPEADARSPQPATATATEDEGDPPATSSEPSSAPTMDDILAVSGGEEIPPKPRTDEYRALPPLERAQARAYWDRKPQDEQESLAVALGAPES